MYLRGYMGDMGDCPDTGDVCDQSSVAANGDQCSANGGTFYSSGCSGTGPASSAPGGVTCQYSDGSSYTIPYGPCPPPAANLNPSTPGAGILSTISSLTKSFFPIYQQVTQTGPYQPGFFQTAFQPGGALAGTSGLLVIGGVVLLGLTLLKKGKG